LPHSGQTVTVVVDAEGADHHLGEEAADADPLAEDRGVDLERLGREVEEALDHVATEEDGAGADRVVGALDGGDPLGGVHELVDARRITALL
jgi:hypothetical protein